MLDDLTKIIPTSGDQLLYDATSMAVRMGMTKYYFEDVALTNSVFGFIERECVRMPAEGEKGYNVRWHFGTFQSSLDAAKPVHEAYILKERQDRARKTNEKARKIAWEKRMEVITNPTSGSSS